MKNFDEILKECGESTSIIEIPNYCLHEDFEEPEQKLAVLLANDVIFINNGWHKTELGIWPKDKITVHIKCNDVFAWGCADSEDLDYSEIGALYKMWKKDPDWGPAVFCIMKRNKYPQQPVAKIIKEQGIWDISPYGDSGNDSF